MRVTLCWSVIMMQFQVCAARQCCGNDNLTQPASVQRRFRELGNAVTLAFLLAVAGGSPWTSPALADHISVENLGFESGNSAGWSTKTYSNAHAATSYGSFTPVSGKYIGILEGIGPNTPATMDQTISMQAGDSLSFYVGFQGNDYLPYNDSAYSSISWSTGSELLFSSSIAEVGNYGNSGWHHVHFIAPVDDQYLLEFGVIDGLDYALHSAIVVESTPEPATLALLAIGMVGCGATRYYRRRAQTQTTVQS